MDSTAKWNDMRKRWFLAHMDRKRVCTQEAPAKINLGLHILRRRADGYHDLQTIFYPLRWADTLHMWEAPSFSLTCDEPALPCDESNLVMRAARALAAETGESRGAGMMLQKRVPMGAGLGGGSSDAAATLRQLLRLWDRTVPRPVLHRMARSLGSDVPFFLDPKPAYATGRGEVLNVLKRYALPYALVVVVPPVHISTAWAFGQVQPARCGRADLRDVVCSNDLAHWRTALVNDFEGPVFAAHPVLRARKEALLGMGAGYAALTGTGSAVFGIFESDDLAQEAARQADAEGCAVHWQAAA